ncbi:MAG: hypothetical protein R3B52_03550 [Candidatus Paceibacterota bacterium]
MKSIQFFTLLILASAFFLVPNVSLAAIQFDFMSDPAALSDAAREIFVDKVKEIDLDKVKEDIREYSDEVPDSVKDSIKDIPSEANEALEESGIEAKSIFGKLFEIFSNLFGFVIDLFKSE